MMLNSFIAQVSCSVRKPSSSKDFWPWARREILGCRVAQHSTVCNLRIVCAMLVGGEEVEREGKSMDKSEEKQDVQEAPAEWISVISGNHEVTREAKGQHPDANFKFLKPSGRRGVVGLGQQIWGWVVTSKQHGHLKNPWTLFLPCCLERLYFLPL